MAPDLSTLLAASVARHSHLCPRQVLGVRAGLAAGQALDLDLPRRDKALLVILETDGCFADGVEVATGVTVGHRTLRVEDYGKIAATFANTRSGQALRLVPRPQARQAAWNYAGSETRPYYAQLHAYQVMPADELFTFQEVKLRPTLREIISLPGARACCSRCGEEINNEREIHREGAILCRACAGPAYYTAVTPLPYATPEPCPEPEDLLPGS